MSFTVKGSRCYLFNSSTGDFHHEVLLSYSQDKAKKQFTVKVNGIRAYSKLDWNFTTHFYIRLATDRAGNNATSASGDLPRSGNDDYRGWIPASGWNTSAISFNRTFNYNSDGSVPDVFLYVRAYNDKVLKLSTGSWVKANSEYHANISGNIGSLDVSTAGFSVSKTAENASSIGFKTKLNSGNSNSPSKWYVKVDNTDYAYSISGNIEKTYTVGNSKHTIQVDNENAYGKRAGWKTLNYDTTLPKINSKDLIPVAINKARLKCSFSHDCSWSLSGSNMTTVTGNGTSIDQEVTVGRDVNQQYTLRISRKDNSYLTASTTIYCNTITPKLTLNNVSTVADAMHITVTSDIPCKDWTFELLRAEDNTLVKSVTSQTWNNSKSITTIISPLELEVPYILKVSATNNVNRGLITSIQSAEITCHGCAYIYDNEKPLLGAAMIYDTIKGRWVGSIPYMYDEEKGWLRTTVE